MKVSSATAVLPVWRSPMISSRWPRPIGTKASSAFNPVWTGSWTDLRGMIPGALNSTQQPLADRHVDDGAGPLDGRAFLDLGVRAENHDADIVGLEVERHALGAVLELDHLARLDVVEAVDSGDAVADRQCGADFRDF